MAPERRRQSRQKLQSLEYVEIGRENEGNGGFLLDLSEDGAAIQMAHPAPFEDEFQFRFSLGAHGSVEGGGHLVWRDHAGKALGVAFTDLDDAARARIAKWLAENEGVPGYEWTVTSVLAAPHATLHATAETEAVALAQEAAAADARRNESIRNDATASDATSTRSEAPASQPELNAVQLSTAAIVAETAIKTPPDEPRDVPAADAAPASGEARFVNIAAQPRKGSARTKRQAPPATPTARFIDISSASAGASPAIAGHDAGAAADVSPAVAAAVNDATVHGGAAHIASDDVGPGILAARRDTGSENSTSESSRKEWPLTPPYFGIDNDTGPAPSPTQGVPGGGKREPPIMRRPLVRGAVVAAAALVIALTVAYLMGYSGSQSQETSAAMQSATQQESQANAQPANPSSNPASNSDDEFTSLYPAPLGPSATPNSLAPYTISSPSPAAISPSSTDKGRETGRHEGLGEKSTPGQQLGKGPHTTAATNERAKSIDAGAPETASGTSGSGAALGVGSTAVPAPGTSPPGARESAGESQPGDREFESGMQSLAGRSDNPGSQAAASHFWKAVSLGNVRAEVQLAALYLRGDGVPKDCDQARVLLDSAAGHGNVDATHMLAFLPSYGCDAQASKTPGAPQH